MGADPRRYGSGGLLRPRQDGVVPGSGGRARLLRLSLALGTAAALLAGCASIPDSGGVEPVTSSPRGESQVRVYAVPPRAGADPEAIVDGFLEAMTSDDPGFTMARKYLTKEASRAWRPEDSTTVLRAAPDPRSQEGGATPAAGFTYPLYGDMIAHVDAAHVYQPRVPSKEDAYSGEIHLVQERTPDGKDREWRIDNLPPGLVLGESDFQRNYRSVNTYYFASGQDWLVADPVYIRQRIDPTTRMDPVTQAVKVLLEGPTKWLRPVVDSLFPAGTQLQKGTQSLEFDDRNALKVPLNEKAAGASRSTCRKMAAQILFTLRDLTATPVRQVELLAGGSSLCVLSGDQAEEFAADRTTGQDHPYFVDKDGRLALMPGDGDGDTVDTVPGPLGDGSVKLDSVAVARDERRAAGVKHEGEALYVSSIVSDGELGAPLLTSRGKRAAERLSAPSWDGRGDLWIADRDPEKPRLYRFVDGAGPAESVTVEGLGGARIEALRVSADGVRVALLLSQDGRTTLRIGRVERHGTAAKPTVSVAELQSVAPQMDTVTAVSWAGPSRLVVAGKEPGGVQQVSYIQTDGSTSAASVLPGLDPVTAITASDDDSRPVVADSRGAGIVRLPSGANWQTVVGAGTSPVYPG